MASPPERVLPFYVKTDDECRFEVSVRSEIDDQNRWRAGATREYLQATLLTLKPHSIQGSIRLVPGVLVASDVIASIDANGDGAISPEEEHTYAQQVLNSIFNHSRCQSRY